MADKQFFNYHGSILLGVIAEKTGAELPDAGVANKAIADVQPLQAATTDDLSFIDNRRYLDVLETTQAGACFAHPDVALRVPKGTIALLSQDPYRAYATAAQLFYPAPTVTPTIHASALIDPSAFVSPSARVDAGAIIEADASVGERSWIGAHTIIHKGSKIGSDCRIGAQVTIQCAIIGDRVTLHPGVRVGQDGFGFAPGVFHLKVPQLGRVMIGNDVEIGANTCIDRGTGPDTVVGDGCKIDNMVQIAHNVRLGQHCLLAAHVGISGSTTIGNYTMVGGQAGFAGHLTIGDGVKIAAQSGVIRDVPSKSSMGGSPAVPVRDFFRSVSALERLAAKKRT